MKKLFFVCILSISSVSFSVNDYFHEDIVDGVSNFIGDAIYTVRRVRTTNSQFPKSSCTLVNIGNTCLSACTGKLLPGTQKRVHAQKLGYFGAMALTAVGSYFLMHGARNLLKYSVKGALIIFFT